MNGALIARLQNHLRESLQSAVPDRTQHYAILDFPNYSNIGDSAIYVGEKLLLSEYFGRAAALVTEANLEDLSRVSQLRDVDLLFLQGGGNFGDLWPRHQHFRESVLRQFPQKKIVQLPQSIFFKDPDKLATATTIINGHPNFTLMVRDRVSESTARQQFTCQVVLTPDMAFMIGKVGRHARPDCKSLCLIRNDQESRFEGELARSAFPKPTVVTDWPAEHQNRALTARLVAKANRLAIRLFSGSAMSYPAYNRLAERRLSTGLRLLSRGEIVVTDRLHAHILCLLLGIPHVVLDNSYGKISTFIDAWTNGGNFRVAQDPKSAAELAGQLLPS